MLCWPLSFTDTARRSFRRLPLLCSSLEADTYRWCFAISAVANVFCGFEEIGVWNRLSSEQRLEAWFEAILEEICNNPTCSLFCVA